MTSTDGVILDSNSENASVVYEHEINDVVRLILIASVISRPS